jgi:hypothetical protein
LKSGLRSRDSVGPSVRVGVQSSQDGSDARSSINIRALSLVSAAGLFFFLNFCGFFVWIPDVHMAVRTFTHSVTEHLWF